MNDLILRAARLATTVHNGQKRKCSHFIDEPYIFHPMRVSGLVTLSSQVTYEIAAAAWVHDTIEDAKNPDEVRQVIKDQLGYVVYHYVEELTNASKTDLTMKGKSRAERKAADRAKIATISKASKIIKLADRVDNLREAISNPKTPADWLKTYIEESKMLFAVLQGTDDFLERHLTGLLN